MDKPCSITCIFSAVFVVAMIFMTNWMTTNQTTLKYQNQLPEHLQQTYMSIVKERTQIFYTGYALGLFLALFVIFYNMKIKQQKMNWPSMVCLTVFIAFLTNYFYYVLSPKTKWMLNSIDTPEQTKAWFEMYRTMQLYYHGSLVLGIIAIGLVAFAFRC
jgi:MFS family permease